MFKPAPTLAVLLAAVSCPSKVVETLTPCPEVLDQAALRSTTVSARASLTGLSSALDAAGVDAAAQQKLSVAVADTYNPWGLDDEVEGTVLNPLFEAAGSSGDNPMFESASLIRTGLTALSGAGASSLEDLDARRDLVAAWQGWMAAVSSSAHTATDGPWSTPAVRTAVDVTRADLSAAHCVLATLAEGSDRGVDACGAAGDLLATDALVKGTSALTAALVTAVDARRDALASLRTDAVSFAEAVGAVQPESDAHNLALALIDAIDAAAEAEAPTDLAALDALLAREAPAFHTDLLDVRTGLRDATLHTAAHEAAHVVQQRSAQLDALFAQDGGVAPCKGIGLSCVLSSVSVQLGSLDPLLDIEAAARAAASAAADKEPVPEARAALLASLQALRDERDAQRATWDALVEQFQSVSNVLKTRHETAKNSISNVR